MPWEMVTLNSGDIDDADSPIPSPRERGNTTEDDWKVPKDLLLE